uniref:Uncharacterized protein n=1 Tax=Panagrolaimus sp. PS1159 TaxID=55785 RepID=A0AC35EUM4_9BILA
MMKLTVIVLLSFIGIAIALHGTSAYGNGGGNGGGGHKHHKSSESSSSSESKEFIKPQVCKTTCFKDAIVDTKVDGIKQQVFKNEILVAECQACCQNWALLRGFPMNEISGLKIERNGTTNKDCVCCQRKCT